MTLSFLGFEAQIPEESKLDADGKYLPFPMYDDEFLPLYKQYSEQIDELILVSNAHIDVSRKSIVKLVDRLTIDGDIIEIYEFDFDNKKLMKFLGIYASNGNWLNLFVKSRELELLRKFYYLFPKPYREKIEYQEVLGKQTKLAIKNERDLENLVKVVSELDEDSFLVSSTYEECFHCIFAGPKILNLVKSWEPRPWS